MSCVDLRTPFLHVGEAPPDFSSDCLVSFTVYFNGFADLPQEKGSFVKSSNFRCLGHEWYLKLYPRGDEDSGDNEEWVFLYLHHSGDGSIV